MPPGPFPYPFIGNLPQLFCDPVSPYSKLADKFGDIFTVTLPNGDISVVLSSASLVREARLGNHDTLAGKLPNTFYPYQDIFGKDTITVDWSPDYRFRRRVFQSALHAFGNAGKARALLRAGHAVNIVISEIDSMEGQSFSPRKLLESSILVQLWEWLTTKKVELNDPTIQKLAQFNIMGSQLALLSNLYQMIPFSKYLPTQFKKDIQRAQYIRNTIFPQEYLEHKKTYTPGVIRDLTDSFICCYENQIAKNSEKEIGSMDDIPGLMIDVTFAGSDTTSSSLAWMLLYMVLHPDVQENIHKELDFVLGDDRPLNWKDSESMPYLQATICEVVRASGMMGVVGSNAIRDFTISGYHIPKGTFVALNLAKLHHDEREWPENEKFKPERFLDSDGKFVGWEKYYGFLPFSAGRRDCSGRALGKIILFTFASELLRHYKFELPEGDETPSTEISNPAIIRRPNDFKIVAIKRDSAK